MEYKQYNMFECWFLAFYNNKKSNLGIFIHKNVNQLHKNVHSVSHWDKSTRGNENWMFLQLLNVKIRVSKGLKLVIGVTAAASYTSHGFTH